MDKKIMIACIIKELERQKSELENGLRSTRQAAKDSPSAMESHSDTTRNQMQALATNMERMMEKKESAIRSLQKLLDSDEKPFDFIKEGIMIEIEGEDRKKHFYLMAPEGGSGVTISENGVSITSIASETPLGMTLINKKTGDTVTLKNKNGDRNLKILNLS